MKSWFKYLLYVSLLFLAVALYKADYLKVPKVFSFLLLTSSLLFVFGGFLSCAVSWHQVLKTSTYPATFSECLAGIGLSIFGKYIPGKVWGIVGRAAYIADRNPYPLGRLSAISLNAQFIEVWIALTLGATGLFLLHGFHLWGWLVLSLWLTFTILCFSKVVPRALQRIIKTVFRKDISVLTLALKAPLSVVPWFFLYWMLWSIGFYFLVASLTALRIPWSVAFGFPLAAALAIIVVISPGGLGAREGVLVGYLTLAGLPFTEATTIAVASRAWFLLGETFIFFVGFATNSRLRRAPYRKQT